MARWHAAVAAAVRAATSVPSDATAAWSAAAGSSLNATASLVLGERRFFVKTNDRAHAAMLDAEGDGLRAIARTGAIRVPMPIVAGVEDDVAYLVLEWLDFAAGGHDAALGRALAALHRHTGSAFGWHRDNTIGTTPQINAWCDTWPAFFRDRRIAPQLALAAKRGYTGTLQRSGERLLDAISPLLASHAPAPSLLHGDLWSGNAARISTGEAVIFDPAVYYGDREADLAMTELFGGFGRDFYDAYDDAWPRDDGYAARKTLYNLYHVLNHANLFGGGYVSQAERIVAELVASAR